MTHITRILISAQLVLFSVKVKMNFRLRQNDDTFWRKINNRNVRIYETGCRSVFLEARLWVNTRKQKARADVTIACFFSASNVIFRRNVLSIGPEPSFIHYSSLHWVVSWNFHRLSPFSSLKSASPKVNRSDKENGKHREISCGSVCLHCELKTTGKLWTLREAISFGLGGGKVPRRWRRKVIRVILGLSDSPFVVNKPITKFSAEYSSRHWVPSLKSAYEFVTNLNPSLIH